MEAATPTYGDVFGTMPVATLMAGWEFWDDWRLDGAIRYAYSDGAVNWFGSYTQGLVEDTQRPFFSPGTHYSIARNVEIGLRVGWGLTDEAAPFFSDAGIAIQY